MKKKKAGDFILMIATVMLVFIGIIMVFSSSFYIANEKLNNPYFFLKKQVIASVLGTFALIFFMNFPYWRLERLSKLIFIVSIGLSLLILTPLGVELNGAKRWVDLGFTTFMPSDAMKIGSIIFLTSYLAKKGNDIRKIVKGLLPALLIIGISIGTILMQKDLSTSAALGLTLMIILFIGGMKLSHIIIMGSGGLGAGIAAIMMEDFRQDRIVAFLDPFKYKTGVGWQVVQSLYALGSGGVFGAGLGKSRQKMFYIPEPYNDYIFAIIGEELGFIGGLTVIALFLLVIWRGIRIAINSKDNFGCLLASGIVSLITVQTLIHIAVVTSSMPPTGIPLPFISYGGTSLIVYMAAIGILLNISRMADTNRS